MVNVTHQWFEITCKKLYISSLHICDRAGIGAFVVRSQLFGLDLDTP